MADRTVSVKLQADVAGYMANLRTAARETQKFGKDVAAATGQRRADLDMLGKGLLGVGTAALAGLGMATKAAIDWESAWAGVEKTVDGNATQMATLEGQLRDLATSLPATHDEIAGIAEAAGALGVKREDIADFTETMIALGESTDLTADMAANAIARISTVMGTSMDDVDRFGSALVALGNDGASTESEILSMAERIAGAGNQIGLAETDVLGFASALSSVGIEAEAGGSSISTAMVKIATAVNQGGDSVEGFAEVAGVSGKRFTQMFQQDAAGAIVAFVEGLGRMQDAGGDVFGTLSDLGLAEIRTRDAMLRLAGAGDMLRDSLDLGADAWRENTALTDEAQKRYDTAASKIQVAWNNIKDAAIDVGSAIAPVIGGLADVVGGLADAFDLLPGPVKDALGLLGGLAGILAVAGGAFLLFAPRIANTRRALNDLGVSMGGFGKKAALAAGGILAISLASSALDAALASAPAELEAMTIGMEHWAESGRLSGEAARIFGDDAGQLKEALSDVADTGFTKWLAGVAEDIPLLGQAISGVDQPIAESARIISAADSALEGMVKSGNLDAAAAGFRKFAKFADEQGIPIERLNEILPLYNAALEVAADKTGETSKATEGAVSSFEDLLGLSDELGRVGPAASAAADSMDMISEAFSLTGENAEDTAKNVDEMISDWAEAFAEFAPLVGAYEEALAIKEEAERKSAEKTAESTEDSKDSWEDYVGDVTVSVDEYLEQLERMVEDQEAWADNMIGLAGKVPSALLDELADMGPEGAGLVGLLNRMTSKELKKYVKLWEESGQLGGQGFANKLAEAGPMLEKIARESGEKAAQRVRDGMKKHGTDVYTEAKRQGVLIDKGVDVDRKRVVKVETDGHPAVRGARTTRDLVNQLLNGIDDEPVEVTFTAAQIGGHPTSRNAEGNLYERHDAQIAPGGAWRVWAEPETGGEAYIPLAESKRARSMSILEQVANRFGASLMPFADGGATVRLSSATSGINYSNLAGIVQSIAQDNVAKMIAAGMLGISAGFGGAPSAVSGNQAIVKSIFASMFGWGAHWPATYQLVMKESGFRNTAQNPTSTAYGMFQFLDSTWAGTGIGKTSDPRLQAVAGGRYIDSRYGNPSAALQFHLGHNWYADGGVVDGMHPMGSFRYGTKHVPWDGMYQLHRGEKVTPSGSGAGTTVVNINGPVYGDRRHLRELLVTEIDTLKAQRRV